MDLDAYVAEHAGQWRRLEDLARRRKLGPEEADELAALYQRAATHLSALRRRSPDPAPVAPPAPLAPTAPGPIPGRSALPRRTRRPGLSAALPPPGPERRA